MKAIKIIFLVLLLFGLLSLCTIAENIDNVAPQVVGTVLGA